MLYRLVVLSSLTGARTPSAKACPGGTGQCENDRHSQQGMFSDETHINALSKQHNLGALLAKKVPDTNLRSVI
jgi:hypothetical protein